MIDFVLRRTKRKNILIKVGLDGIVYVYASKRTAEARINQFVLEKQAWIEKNVAEMKKREQLQPRLKLQDGESISILGEQLVIKVINDLKTRLDGKYLLLSNENRLDSFLTFIKQLARLYIDARAKEISKLTGLKYNKLTITSAKTRWGSCNAKNDLCFTFRLIFCQKTAVDYIIIHELCHTLQKNHSRAFWNEVQRFMPDYKDAENYLKDNVAIINLI